MVDCWQATTLGECANLLSGGTPSKKNPEYWDGDIPWVSAKDMKSFRLFDSEDHVTGSGAANGTRVVESGTILVLTRGMTLHKDVPICIAMRDMAFNQDVRGVQAKAHTDPSFLAYWLLEKKQKLLRLVDAASHGTGRIFSKDLQAMPGILPPIAEQRAIASILGALDDKIELNHRMNQTLESIARAIFKSWFVDFDPVRAKMEGRQPWGMDAETAALFPDSFEDSPLGKIPVGWQVDKVGEVVKIVGGSTPSTKNQDYWNGSVRFATPRDMAGLEGPLLLDTARRITDEGLNRIGSGLLPAGTVLLSSRAPVGYLAIAEEPVSINQGIIAMVGDDDLLQYFLLSWSEENLPTIVGLANGTTFAEISKRTFRGIDICVPPAALLVSYGKSVHPLYRKIRENMVMSETLKKIRDALLPKLISGEIRVKDADKFMEEHAC